MQRLIKEYGNESIYLNYGTGTLGGTMTRSWPPGKTLVARLMNCCGGYLNHYGDYSSAQIAAGLNYTYGGWATVTARRISKTASWWCCSVTTRRNAHERRRGNLLPGTGAAKSNARMIIIDPRYTDTGAGREDEWIPIRPGTDAALVSALAWVMITENLVDQPFLDKYCVGYDEKTLPASAPANGHYKAYILGQGSDGVAKTPSGRRPSPVFRSSVLFSWRVKLAQPNRPISARAGGRSAMRTVKSPPARSPCCLF
jgi:anaerobic dimethyl sulfoxide reductase subunit A